MAPPIYFLGGNRKASDFLEGERVKPGYFDSLGIPLGDVRYKRQLPVIESTGTRETPGKTAGVFVTAHGRDGRIPDLWGYYPAKQTWVDLGNDVWLGWETANPPGPEDLERFERFVGEPIEIEGREWIVPVVRRYNGSTGLPSRSGWTRDGKYEERIEDRYRKIWEDLDPFFAMLVGASPAIPPEASADLCIRGLALNYRIGRAEQTAFGPVRTTNRIKILCALADIEFARLMADTAKKKQG